MTALLLAAMLASQVPEGALLLDGLAATVEREVITRSDVERVARLAMVRRGAGVHAATLPVDDQLRTAVLNMLIVEELVLVDARRRQRYPEDDKRLSLQVARFKGLFPSDRHFQEFLTAAFMTENEFMERMRREVLVDLLLNEQMHPGAITDADIDEALRTVPEFAGATDAAARAKARAYVLRKRSSDAAMAYVNSLREKSSVKVVAQFAPEDPSLPTARPAGAP